MTNENLYIKVTKNNIKKGKPINPFQCPIAIAIQDTGQERVRVASGYAKFQDRTGETFVYILPAQAVAFTKHFDYCNKKEFCKLNKPLETCRWVKPFSFELNHIAIGI